MSENVIVRYAFPKLVVRDLDRQAAFYRSAFGYGDGHLVEERMLGRSFREFIFHNAAGKIDLILVQFTEGPEPEPSGVISGFMTPDLDVLQERVLAAGGSVGQAIKEFTSGGRTARIAVFADPEGYVMEVIEG